MTTHRTNWLQTAGGTLSARPRIIVKDAGGANRECISDEVGTLGALKKDARQLGCYFRKSPSLEVRCGQGLKGVLVMFTGDARSLFARLTGKLFSAGGLLAAGDRVLVELPAGDASALKKVCGDVPLAGMFRGAGCYGIAHPQIFGMTLHLRREADAAADGSLKQNAFAALNTYVESKETIRARGVHMRSRVMQHHRPGHATYLLVDAGLSFSMISWVMNPLNRLDAVVVGS
jgi:hypothetical protein